MTNPDPVVDFDQPPTASEDSRTTPAEQPPGPVGLDGWLILPLVFILFSTIGFAVPIIGMLRRLSATIGSGTDPWTLITGPWDAWLPVLMLPPGVGGDKIFNMVAFHVLVGFGAGFGVLCLALALRRSAAFPRLATRYLVWVAGSMLLYLLYSWIEHGFPSPHAMELRVIVRDAVLAAGSIAYLRKSKRVKNTFVR